MNRIHSMSINARKLLGALALIICFTSVFAQEAPGKRHKKEIVGYYPNWQQYKRGGMFHQNNLDFSKYTLIEYAFMGLDAEGNIYLVDPWGDGKILDGEIDWSLTTDEEDPEYVPYTNMVSLAHKEGTGVMLSVGGWTLSTNFPIVAADPKKRARFAESCVEVCRKYNFDGIDIDWEFPGAAPGNGCEGGPEDKENFNLMIDQIRDSLDVFEKEVNQKMYLTAAFHSVPYLAQQVDWEHVSEVLDYVNLFGYDFYGAWYKAEAIPQSPLYPPAEGHGDFGVNQADGFMLLTEVYGVPAEKIILGIGFYGRSIIDMKGGPALYAEHGGAVDMTNFPLHEGSPAYFEIIEKYPEYDVMWDEDMKVPYMLGKKSNSFVGYDDLVSVQYKASFICQQGAAGCLIWEISQDLIEKPAGSGNIVGTPLIDVINEVFEQYEETGSYDVYGNEIDLIETEKLKESYFRRDAQIAQKQASYSQDEQPAAVDATEEAVEEQPVEVAPVEENIEQPVQEENVEQEKVEEPVQEETVDAPVQEEIKEEKNVGEFEQGAVVTEDVEKKENIFSTENAGKDVVSEETRAKVANNLDLTDDDAVGVFEGVTKNKNEIRNGENFFKPGEFDILFDKNSSDLSLGAKQNIKSSAKFVVSTGVPIVLTGFSSSDGNADYNLKLSKRRVESVRAYLIEMINFYGDANDIEVNAEGKVSTSQGGVTSDFGTNLSHNRRVTISYKSK